MEKVIACERSLAYGYQIEDEHSKGPDAILQHRHHEHFLNEHVREQILKTRGL